MGRYYQHRNEDCILTDCSLQHHAGVRSILARVLRLLGEQEQQAVRLLVVGMPNVGKSSVLNALRRIHLGKGTSDTQIVFTPLGRAVCPDSRRFMVTGKCAKTGAQPGVTRAVQEEVRLSDKPRVYIYDTPG